MAAKAFARSMIKPMTLFPCNLNGGPCHLQRKGVVIFPCSSTLFRRSDLGLGLGSRRFSTNDQHNEKTDNLPREEKARWVFPDFHNGQFWRVHFEYQPGMNRDQLIDAYVNCLASAFGSEEQARRRMHSCTRHGYFTCNVPGNFLRSAWKYIYWLFIMLHSFIICI